MPQEPITAETIADSILRTAGTGLRHYTMHSIRADIVASTQSALLAAERRGQERIREQCAASLEGIRQVKYILFLED
jgi:hypothetical protein